MDQFFRGQRVTLKTLEQICEEQGFDVEDVVGDLDCDNYIITTDMYRYLGCTFTISDVDSDDTVYISETGHWWGFEAIASSVSAEEASGYKPGDRVEFLTYQEMHGVPWFVDPMRYLCGMEGTITGVSYCDNDLGDDTFCEVFMNDENGEKINWSLNTRMIRHVKDTPPIQIDDWMAVLRG